MVHLVQFCGEIYYYKVNVRSSFIFIEFQVEHVLDWNSLDLLNYPYDWCLHAILVCYAVIDLHYNQKIIVRFGHKY